MALSLHQIVSPDTELGIWNITESEDWFRQQLTLSAPEQAQLDLIKGSKRTEWLSARQLVHIMSGRTERGAFIKDEFGKPHLQNSDWYISISHSHGKSAAIASTNICGIDIQFIVPKIERIAPKFMREEEMNSLNDSQQLLQLHIYWTAKEALYKAYGRKQLDFRKHIHITPFDRAQQQGQLQGQIIKNDIRQTFQLEYQIIDDYVLTFALLNEKSPLPPFANL